MTRPGCGVLGRDCCPVEQAEGTLCNKSNRYKITPGKNENLITGQGSSGWTKTNPGGVAKTNNTIIPSGLIPNSTGEFKYDDSFDKYWGLCGERRKDCYNDYNLSATGVGGPNISKLDEYYTACGFGLPSLWPSDALGSQVRRGSRTNPDRYKGLFAKSIITEGRGGTCDAQFPTESGFSLIESNTCNLYEEREQLKLNGAVYGTSGGHTDGYAWGIITHNDPGDIACHYKYRKDWTDRVWGVPPRFKSGADEESVYDPLYIDVDTGIPKARMACCTSYDTEQGKFTPINDINGDEIICPLTESAMDNYSNNEIEKYGAGVYDPGSNVCARYNPDRDGPDTPDKWCSHNITEDDDEFSRGSDGKPVIKVLSDPYWDIKYTKYIKLLIDTSCIRWLELDYEQSLTSEQLPFKPRSRALGNELKEFFIWVSANLANNDYTPVSIVKSPNGIRNDLIQVDSKMVRRGFQQGCPSGTVEATQYIRDRSINSINVCNSLHLLNKANQKVINACNSDNPEIKAEIDASLTRNGLTCELVTPLLASGSCTNPSNLLKLNECTDLDSQNCTKSFYSITYGNTKTYYPCYQYEKNQGEWKAKSISHPGTLIDPRNSDPSLTSSGCGYHPEVGYVENDDSEKKRIIEDYLRTRDTEYLKNLIDEYPGYSGLTEDLNIDEMITMLYNSGMFDFIYEIAVPDAESDPRECIGGNLGICCNYLNTNLNLEDILNAQEKRTLFDTNFDANTTLGKFLNFLTTRAAGAFLHHSNYSTSKSNSENEFIINMKKFCSRADIFDWREIVESDPQDVQDYKKNYNDLLKARYSKICNCFWEWDETPAFGNPVKEEVRKHYKFNICRSINADSNYCNDKDCGLLNEDEKTACQSNAQTGDGLVQQIIDFYSNKDPTRDDQPNIDNSCWYWPCWSAVTSNSDYTEHEKYGLNTRNTKDVNQGETGAHCKQGSCKYACIAQNIVDYDEITITGNSQLVQKINQKCFASPSPALSEDDNDPNARMCGVSGQEVKNQRFTESQHEDFHVDTRHNQPSSSPSPSPSEPSPSEPSPSFFAFDKPWKIVVAVVAIVIFSLWVISLVLNYKGESKGGEKSVDVLSDPDPDIGDIS